MCNVQDKWTIHKKVKKITSLTWKSKMVAGRHIGNFKLPYLFVFGSRVGFLGTVGFGKGIWVARSEARRPRLEGREPPPCQIEGLEELYDPLNLKFKRPNLGRHYDASLDSEKISLWWTVSVICSVWKEQIIEMTPAVVKAATHILVQQKCGTWHWYNELNSEIYASKCVYV